MYREIVKFSLLTLGFIFLQMNTMAQCAMCRASIENNASNGDTALASSLNTGIMYLFATPYLAIIIVGSLWYYTSKKNGRKK
jgi:hypothetical protein